MPISPNAGVRALTLPCPALCGALSYAFVLQYNGLNHWLFAQGQPAHAFGCPAVRVFCLDYSAYWCLQRRVLVQFLQFTAGEVC